MKKILLLIALTIFLSPAVSRAQDTYTLLEPLPCIPGTDQTCADNKIKEVNLSDYIGYIFKFSIALAAFLAVIMIIWGGVQYMTSEVPFIKIEGKNKIGGAVAGLVMVLASYLILATIDPRLVNIDTSIPQIRTDQASLDAVETFRNELTAELSRLSGENQVKFIQIEAETKRLNDEKAGVEADLRDGRIEEEEAEKKIGLIDNELREIRSERSKLVTENIGLNIFQNAYQNINNAIGDDDSNIDQYTREQVPNVLSNNLYPVGSTLNPIQNAYNLEINKIHSTDPETAELLGKQRDFYIEQINEEINISKIKQGFYSDDVRDINAAKNDLTRILEETQLNLLDSQKQIESGLSEEQYIKMLQTRVSEIDKLLESDM